MNFKKIGKAVADPEAGLWRIEKKPHCFRMNLRLVEKRPEVKAAKTAYSKHAQKFVGGKTGSKKRDDHFQKRDDLKAERDRVVVQAYAEILKDSFEYPVPLRKEPDHEHGGDWRYCLYRGEVYQFDRADYAGDVMMEAINEKNGE